MKEPAQILTSVRNRLERSWFHEVTTGPCGDWPHPFPLGEPTGADLETDFAAIHRQAETWWRWAADQYAALETANRRVSGTFQQLPTHLQVATVDEAARLLGGTWPDRLARGRARQLVLAERFPLLGAGLSTTVRDTDLLGDQDFQTLCAVGEWFRDHGGEAAGLTPRQVPVPGVHAKWLNTNRRLVARLAGLGDEAALGLLPPHPARIHFTYLDSAYLATGGRRHDSATVGDHAAPAYRPRVVIISENKDTAIHFPPIPGGISIEGVGRGGGTVASFSWVRDAQILVYWGDMDADGMEILDGFRTAGLPVQSILMDGDAYETWERYGTNTDPKGRPLGPRPPRLVPTLTDTERGLYHDLCSPGWTRHRRVEQERIPLAVAARIVGSWC
ncbi:DUF2220 family protein [Kribbella sancticallisti]|uniref:DUF2220 family protein n=1 Tax=Kribbella sancticallisti TaxID=460087 RepID=A0ABP4Q9K1_9ACTN